MSFCLKKKKGFTSDVWPRRARLLDRLLKTPLTRENVGSLTTRVETLLSLAESYLKSEKKRQAWQDKSRISNEECHCCYRCHMPCVTLITTTTTTSWIYIPLSLSLAWQRESLFCNSCLLSLILTSSFLLVSFFYILVSLLSPAVFSSSKDTTILEGVQFILRQLPSATCERVQT